MAWIDQEYRILCCGSREWRNERQIREAIEQEIDDLPCPPHHIVVITGAAVGADQIAERVAAQLGLMVRSYPVISADWSKYGRSAGLKRNSEMLQKESPIDFGLAFVRPDLPCSGTWDMVKKAVAAGAPMLVIPGGKLDNPFL